MWEISVEEAKLLIAGFIGAASFLVLDILGLLSRCCRETTHEVETNEQAGAEHHLPGRKSSGKVLLSIILCFTALGASVAELVLPPKTAAGQSRFVHAEIITRIVCAALAVSWHLGWFVLPLARGLPLNRPTGALGSGVCLILAAVLFWRAARLGAMGLHDIPHLHESVYLEGLSAIGCVGALGTCWSCWCQYHAPHTDHPEYAEDHDQSHRLDTAEAPPGNLGSAGWVSLLSFAWLNPLFRIGAMRQLQPGDLPHLAPQDETALWVKRFEAVLKRERERPRPSLIRACRLLFGWEFMGLAWLRAANTGLGFSGPLLLKVVVDAVQGSSHDQGEGNPRATMKGYLGATGLAVCYALSAILDTQFSLSLGRLKLHIRAAIVSAVYRQTLAVRSVDAADHGLTAGTATNLIAVDAQRIMDAAGSLHELWALPVQVGVTFYLLYNEVSFAFAAGLCVIGAMIPLNTVLAKRIGAATRELMKHKDERVQRCAEMLHGIRVVKMLAWEGHMRDMINVSRSAEVSALSKLKYVDAWCVFFWATTPTLVCLATFVALVLGRGDGAAPPLQVSSVFAAVSLLQMLIHPMNAFPWVMNGVVEANVSRNRLEKLLLSTQGAGTSEEATLGGERRSASRHDAIVVWQKVTVSRRRPSAAREGPSGGGSQAASAAKQSNVRDPDSLDQDLLQPLLLDEDGTKSSSEGDQVVDVEEEWDHRHEGFALRGIELEVYCGETVAVLGKVGSGKSTLIEGILGELPWEGTGAGVAPGTRVCYAAQSPWIMTGTVRDNVLFGLPMDEGRYRETLKACALETDLASLPGGDMAYVGERGTTLSGGQRLRVSLARCAYSASTPIATSTRVDDISGADDSSPSVLCLLDDPLTSLDAHTQEHVSKHCIHRLLHKNSSTAVVVAWGERSRGDETASELHDQDAREVLHTKGSPVNCQTVGGNRGRNVDKASGDKGKRVERALGLSVAQESPKAPGSFCEMDEDALAESDLQDVVRGLDQEIPKAGMPPMFDCIVTLDEGRATTRRITGRNKRKEAAGDVNRVVGSKSTSKSTQSFVSDLATVGSFLAAGSAAPVGLANNSQNGLRGDLTSSQTQEGTGSLVTMEGGVVGVDSRVIEFTSANKGATIRYGAPVDQESKEEHLEEFSAAGEHGPRNGGDLASHEETGFCGNRSDTPIEDEERKCGSVELRVYFLYIRSAGLALAIGTILSLGLMQASSAGFRYWLSYWATHQARISIKLFLMWSFSIAALNTGFTLLRAFGFAYGGIRAAVAMHERLLAHVTKKKTSFFDVTPSGRVVNRFSRDAFSVDDPLAFHLNILLAQASGLVATAVVLSWTSPILVGLFLPLGFIYDKLQKYYRSTSRELRRLDSTSRSPIYALFAETLDGANTIRAFAQEGRFCDRFLRLLGDNQRATFAGSMASAWLSLRLQALGVVVIAAVAFLAVAQHQWGRSRGDEGASERSDFGGLVGLSLTYALPIVGNLTGLLGALTDTEREMISVERMDEYCRGRGGSAGASDGGTNAKRKEAGDSHDEEIEKLGGQGCHVLADWPERGRLEINDVVMRYRASLRPALGGISLTVEAGQRLGVVGRTGSGKSSLLKVLFGLYSYEGKILIDGIDVAALPLHVLRSRLAIIPQEPLLFRGTIRENLDPARGYSDVTLWQALRICRLSARGGDGSKSTTVPRGVRGARGAQSASQPWYGDRPKSESEWEGCGSRGVGTLGLETELEGDGSNVSAGERQLLCIARAMVRRSKIVCLDEPTSTMDAGTAEAVDAIMGDAFRGSTVLTVAHRLSSVLKNCDRVAVLSDGVIVEQGNPRDLAADERSVFRALLRVPDCKMGDGIL